MVTRNSTTQRDAAFLVPGYRAIVREIEEIVDQWPDFAAEAQLPPERTDAVRARLSEVRL